MNPMGRLHCRGCREYTPARPFTVVGIKNKAYLWRCNVCGSVLKSYVEKALTRDELREARKC